MQHVCVQFMPNSSIFGNISAVNEKLDILFSEFHKQFIRKQSIDSDRSFNWSALIFQMPDWYPKAFLLRYVWWQIMNAFVRTSICFVR